MKKKLTQFEKFELAEQARQSRDAEWQLAHDEMLEAYEGGSIDATEYFGWFEDNPRPSAIIEEQVAERKRYKRKSKKNIKNNITIIDQDALRDVKTQETKIEWGKGLEE